jgi:hypothetical protein
MWTTCCTARKQSPRRLVRTAAALGDRVPWLRPQLCSDFYLLGRKLAETSA